MKHINKKFIIAGAYESGRETFMASVSDVFSPMRQIGENATAYGRIFLNRQTTYYLYRVSSARRFGYEWQTFIEGASGYILMVDGTRPETFTESKHMLNALRSLYPSIPYIIAVNKQDVQGALDEEMLRMIWKLRSDAPIVPCIATDLSMARAVFSTLLMQSGEALV
jgi:uncharacterized protein